MGILRRSPRLRDRATELGLSRQDIQLIVLSEGREPSDVRIRLRRLVAILRELEKIGSIAEQRAWLHGETTNDEVAPRERLKTAKGFDSVEDAVFCMADILAAAEEFFPYDPDPLYSLWKSVSK